MSYEKSKQTLRIYGCGGCGINLANHFSDDTNDDFCATVKPAFIDTSHSNLKEGVDPDSVYLMDGLDGSGKVRRENHEEISKSIKHILLQVHPGDFNIVIFSGSGGSGSVIGPLILGELLSRGAPTIAIMVGSDESIIAADNNLKTIKTLESISQRSKQPVVLYYERNTRESRRNDVDSQIYAVIGAVSVLASGLNREMDSKDIENWVYFQKTTSVEPQLALLDIYNDSDEADKANDPVSVASVYADEDVKPISMVPEYHAAGYLDQRHGNINELHFVITINNVPSIHKDSQDILDEYHNQRNSRVLHDSILGDDDSATDSGLIL